MESRLALLEAKATPAGELSLDELQALVAEKKAADGVDEAEVDASGPPGVLPAMPGLAGNPGLPVKSCMDALDAREKCISECRHTVDNRRTAGMFDNDYVRGAPAAPRIAASPRPACRSQPRAPASRAASS